MGEAGPLPVSLALSVHKRGWPKKSELAVLSRRAIAAACAETGFPAKRPRPELSVVFSGDDEIRSLNAGWRGKDKPTNVLSFPAMSWPGPHAPPPLLGDIVLALETVTAEAESEAKTFPDHLAHLLVHGFLHLCGHDHETREDAEKMEALERAILARLAIADPYALTGYPD